MAETQSNDTILAKAVELEANLTASTDDIECQENRSLDDESSSLLKEEIADVIHYRELRTTYASRVFYFMCVWSGVVLLILLATGFALLDFTLPSIVVTTLVGGTTISVVGLVGFMMQGLFHTHSRKRE